MAIIRARWRETPRLKIHNPLWDGLQALASQRLVTIDSKTKLLTVAAGQSVSVNTLLARYSRVISDPDLLQWMLGVTTTVVIEVDAGMAYWSYLLEQAGKFIMPHDVNPHPSAYVRVAELDARRSVLRSAVHSGGTLLSIAPEDPRTVATALGAFKGNRAVIVLADEANLSGSVLMRRKAKRAAEARAKLSEALRIGDWARDDTAQGVCLEGALYTARSYRREAWGGTWDEPTQLISTIPLRPAAPESAEQAA